MFRQFPELNSSKNFFSFLLEPDVIEATALFDFDARSPRELSFKRGDVLVLYNQVSQDWWEGCFHGKEGLIPDKYITVKHG